jgi:hypothetical protein
MAGRRKITLAVDERQHAAILAGLRAYQNLLLNPTLAEGVRAAILDIATNAQTVRPLDVGEVGTLCEAINHG